MRRSTRLSSNSSKSTTSASATSASATSASATKPASVSSKSKAKNQTHTQKASKTKEDKNRCPCGFENCSTQVIEDLDHKRKCSCHNTDYTVDNWISCDFCDQWWHSECAGLTVKLCKIIQASEEPYKCSYCVQATIGDFGKKAPLKDQTQKTPKESQKDTTSKQDKQLEKTSRTNFAHKNIVILDGINREAFKGGSPALKRELNRLLGEEDWPFVYRLSRGGIAIHCSNKETVDRILNFKWPNSAFCHSGKNILAHLPGKSPRVVLKNVPTEFSEQEIEASILDTCGIKTKAHRNRYADTGKALPVVTIQCDSLEDSTYIYLNKPQILGANIVVQSYKSKASTATRCFHCNRFGHIAKNCVNTHICVKCGQSHAGKCITPITCTNCKGQHAADSRSCETYIDILTRLQK